MSDNTIPITTVENATAPAIDAFAAGTVIRVSINDDNIAKVVEAGFTHVVLERSVDSGITYDVITTMAPVPLSATVAAYTLVDRGGDDHVFQLTGW